MTPRTLSLLPLALLAAAGAALSHPVVPAYERFTGDKVDARGGGLLLSELGCVACHEAPSPVFAPKTAPILDSVGGRVRVAYLRALLSAPHKAKAGTAMPHLLADDAESVTALVHLLASTGKLAEEKPAPKNVANGKQLFDRSGCAVCHGTRKDDGSENKRLPTQTPLGDLKAKYSAPSLTAFLQDPLHVRPGGRMPRVLDAKDSKDVAHYLLQGLKVVGAAGKGSANYAYYEGDFENVPDFAKLKPKATGKASGFDLGVAPRGTNYAVKFEAVLPVEQEGQYSFTLHSDDGSQLSIDGKMVVNNDGIHPPQSKGGKAKLKKGNHRVVVGFFQGGGGATLRASVSGPGLADADLGDLVAATEDDLKKRPAPKVEEEEKFVLDPALADKGAELFGSLGCASCHQLKHKGKAIASKVKGPPLGKLTAGKGCLSETPAKNLPRYGLSASQKKSLAAAFTPEQVAPSNEAKVANTMLTFDCYACHVRDKVGGPHDETNKTFQTTQPEMGDEGRLPPPLDGVGAKMKADYLADLLDKGVHDRPYMHARMPGFGKANVGHLVALFEANDKLAAVPAVKYPFADARVKSDGRKLTGDGMMACIKCHTFAGKKAEGVQGMDMVKMTQRVKRDWFHHYLMDPQAIRPGTRMPGSFPNGKSFFPDVLDGSPAQQIEALWSYLSDGTGARPPLGVGKAYLPLNPEKTAILYRNFIDGAGPRAIGVGYPEKSHLAFDANELRVAMIWQGMFIDAARHWTDRGAGFEGPLGDNVVKMPTGPTLALLEKGPDWPASAKAAGQRFKGYKLSKDDRPTFLYTVGDVSVEDFPTAFAVGKEQGIRRTFTLTAEKAPPNLYLRAAVGTSIEVRKGEYYVTNGNQTLKVKLTGNGTASVRGTVDGKKQLMFQPRFEDGKAAVTQEIVW